MGKDRRMQFSHSFGAMLFCVKGDILVLLEMESRISFKLEGFVGNIHKVVNFYIERKVEVL